MPPEKPAGQKVYAALTRNAFLNFWDGGAVINFQAVKGLSVISAVRCRGTMAF